MLGKVVAVAVEDNVVAVQDIWDNAAGAELQFQVSLKWGPYLTWTTEQMSMARVLAGGGQCLLLSI